MRRRQLKGWRRVLRIEKSNIETLKTVSSTKSLNNTPWWVWDRIVIRSSLRDSFPVSQTLGPAPLFFFAFGYEVFDWSLPYSYSFPIFVDLFPVVFVVLSSVISDVFLVLLTMGSLAADESFLVNSIPSSTSGFKNLDVLCSPLFLPS